MITHTIWSYQISFILGQSYVVQGYDYKSMNLTKPKMYDINNYICIKYKSSSINMAPWKQKKKVQNTN